MGIRQRRNRFDLNDDLPEANEIGNKVLIQRDPFVIHGDRWLSRERYVLQGEFMLKTLLIDRFSETESLIVIDLKTGSDYPITFFFVKKFFHSFLLLFAFIRVIRGRNPKQKRLPV